MKAIRGQSLRAPSSSLLRFLRSQVDGVCFFTPLTPLVSDGPCQQNFYKNLDPSVRGHRSTTRTLSTTSRRHATVEASLLNLDFLPRYDNFRLLKTSSASRPGIVIQHQSQDSKCASRWVSSDSHSLFRKWLDLGRSAKDRTTALRSSDLSLPFLSDAGGSTLGRMKATNELKLRCTEFDELGNVVVVDGEFKKSELIAKVRALNVW